MGCGIELTKTQHFTHFPQGLFRPTCSGPDDDFILEEEEEPPAPVEAEEAVPRQLARDAGPVQWLGHVLRDCGKPGCSPALCELSARMKQHGANRCSIHSAVAAVAAL